MLKGLATRSPATGMAFTYSGGFRCIVSDNPIDNINKLAGITFVTSHSPVNIDTVEALGAIPKPYFIADYAEKVKAEGADGEVLETTIPRYLSLFKDTNKRYMTNTKHSLFLTSIIVGNKFWESLDFDTQSKLQEACTYASRLERQWSVDDAEQFAAKSDHSDIGVSYRELSAAETAEFKELVSPIVEKYKDFFTPDLVDGIIRA
jgi:TRAP-type C4-dicarboxylate transport system substrate-binding protein